MDSNVANNQTGNGDNGGATQPYLAQPYSAQGSVPLEPVSPGGSVSSFQVNQAVQDGGGLNPAGVSPSPSPEMPAKIEAGTEVVSKPDKVGEVENTAESQEVAQEQMRPQEAGKIDAPKVIPNLTKFENPLKVYGYKVSDQVADMGKKYPSAAAIGDVTLAKTWLLVLVGRLLRMGSPTGVQPGD
ncbi:MAG: hypothetical protein PHS44_00200 [Candidatus Dojkabacteria bacterium]|jgi:hypothetical protein|nr:hypothetical protein [Candidatus Dojkabacteria bacterium]